MGTKRCVRLFINSEISDNGKCYILFTALFAGQKNMGAWVVAVFGCFFFFLTICDNLCFVIFELGNNLK